MEADKQFIIENLDYYSETQGLMPEKLEEYGESFRSQGYLTRTQLYEIAYESSTRSAYHVKKNSKQVCREVTSNLIKVEGGFSQIALLTALKGFKAPTASCVVTALNPGENAVVDTRVWASLERLGYLDERKESFDAEDYVEMIQPIKRIAEKTDYTAAKVGYALFAFDDKVREGNLH